MSIAQQWQRQTIDTHRGPAGDYSCISRGQELPIPPKGSHWFHDAESKEWKIVNDDPNSGLLASSKAALPSVKFSKRDSTENTECQDESKAETQEIHEGVPVSTPLEGVDYLLHTVNPATQTLQGICLMYNLTPTELRRANGGCSGSNLYLFPKQLIIPLKSSKKGVELEQKASEQHAIRVIMQSCKFMSVGRKEALAYLEMAEGDLEEAVNVAKEDDAWERERLEEEKKKKKAQEVGEKQDKEKKPLLSACPRGFC